MSAGLYNFTIEQGTTVTKPVAFENPDGTPVILTEYTAKMQIRDDRDNLILDVGALENGLVIDALGGTITITIDSVTTTGLDFDSAAYDLKILGPDTPPDGLRLLEGVVTFSPETSE